MVATSSTKGLRVEVLRDPEDSRFWLADVVGLEGGHASSRSLATLRKYVHEVIILALDLPDEAEEDLELEWQYHTGDDDVDIATERLRRLRAEHTSDLAHRLVTDSRFSVREAAALLAISPARVDQLVQGARQKGRDQQAA